MNRLSMPIVLCAATLILIATRLSTACVPPATKSPVGRETEGQTVRKYTKIWTDDYGNYHKDVYLAYTKTLKDEKGNDIATEIWHGKATGFHENGNTSWEGEYRDGQREGDYTSWSDNGTKTGRATYNHGLLQGKYTQWNHDGRKMREETYANGKLNGEARWWDMEGNLLTTGTFRDGAPWAGSFPELDASPVAHWSVRRYEAGKKVSEEKLSTNWWW
jgi:hypothetical protein